MKHCYIANWLISHQRMALSANAYAYIDLLQDELLFRFEGIAKHLLPGNQRLHETRGFIIVHT